MDALVIYDSEFGNTRQVAQAIAEIFGARGTAHLLSAEQTAEVPLKGYAILVVGGPTQQHGVSPRLQRLGRIAAARAALDRVAVDLISAGLENCLREELEGRPHGRNTLHKLQRTFLMLR